MNVQGWEPAYDDSVNTGFTAMDLESNFGASSTTTTMTSTSSISGRQAPPTRARAATCPNIYDFTFMPRSGISTVRENSTTSVSTYGSTTQSSVPSSARNAAAAGRSGSRPRSSTERKIARKLAENANYVPRPKNSFILFRTEFVAQRTGGGANQRGRSDEDDEEANQSLSKQASEVWNRMTDDEKKPWVEQAKLEKAAHEAKYPHYRYKPVRHNAARKNLPPPGLSRTGQSPTRELSLQRRCSEPTTMQLNNEEDDRSPNGAMEHDSQVPVGYQTSGTSTNTGITHGANLQLPAPSRKLSLPTASPSSSSLAGALGSRSPTPIVQERSSKPALPSVPPVPALELTETRPTRSSGLPPIPRSPSAPIFDRNAVGQFPYQQRRYQFMPPSAAFPQTQNSYLSAPSPAFATAATSSTSIIASGVSPTDQGGITSPPSSVSRSDLTEPDYFRDFIQCETDMMGGSAPTSSLPQNQRLFTNDYEMRNDNTDRQYELDDMDIDMRALLNLSPLPEVAEPPMNNTDVQRPFEAIAALWMQDQQRTANDSMTTTDTRTEVNLQAITTSPNQAQVPPQIQTSSPKAMMDPGPVFTSPTPKNAATTSSERDSTGLDTYSLAVAGDYFNNSTANPCLEDDLLRLDLDFRPTSRFECSLASSLSMSTLDGTGDAFGYDREQGLYGFGGSTYNNELGIGSGLDYGF